ncbi:hypothetical protein ACH5RR_028766 [Cinchona calisaya]|uniref:NB-ARC domain-containing protein n=1 Tax=Cinchona calisaya TaxID=153742 RepID=A0ABD2YTN4_9GENT
MAAALVGGAFLSAFLQVLFDRIASRDFLKLFQTRKFLEGIMPEIEKIVVRLDGFIQQIVPLGLQNVESKIKSCRTPSTSLVDESTLYGRDVVKEKIIQIESLNSLQVKLQRGQIGKKFLLVLDDVWNRQYSDWNKLKILFQGVSKGSKIIVTTRDEKIARMMGQERSIHRLDFITKEDSWSLFEKHAFGDGDNENLKELEEIGKKITRKCGGLPLAVKTVAGVLRSTRMV